MNCKDFNGGYCSQVNRHVPKSWCIAVCRQQPDRVKKTVDAARERLDKCRQCPRAADDGFKCSLHKGCCFGRYRANSANSCPEGKW
jgi:hypothetical protein